MLVVQLRSWFHRFSMDVVPICCNEDVSVSLQWCHWERTWLIGRWCIPNSAICSQWGYIFGDRVVQCFNFIVLGPSRPHILSRLFHVPLTGLYSMWWVLTVYLGGHSRVLEIVPVESKLHGSVWRASHYCIGITRSRCMHRMMDNVIYVLGMCITYRVQMLWCVDRNGLQWALTTVECLGPWKCLLGSSHLGPSLWDHNYPIQ